MARSPKLGAKIKEARAERGWKQKHLAAEVSVEPITVSRWERGATTPDLDVLGLVAEATGKPLSFFVDDPPSSGTAAGPSDAATADAATLADAVARMEAAATRLGEESERIASLLEAIRADLAGSNRGVH